MSSIACKKLLWLQILTLLELQINKGGGNFAVLSFSDNQKEIYELYFGDTLSMTKCPCIDWNRTGYPCKHFFFAISNKYPAWLWNDLSKLYTENPFLNLDLEVISIANFDTDDKDRRKNELKRVPQWKCFVSAMGLVPQ